MKISKFADQFNVSNDTVRYYMKLNLIVPRKKGGHYYFNEECEREMKEILKLKEMDFSLEKIKEIFYFKRIGKLTPYQRNSYYQGLYKEKVNEIKKKINNLGEAKSELEEEINALAAKTNENIITIGIDLSVLSLFSCPNCNNELKLSAERVEDNQVIEGSLNCTCGVSLRIRDGILYTNNVDKNVDENKKEIDNNHIEKYIKSTNPEFMDESYQSLDWLQRRIEFKSLAGKVIMEPGSGYGYLLRQIYDRLPDDVTYICIDNNFQFNIYLKKLLEMTGKRVKMIFITTDLPQLPLKENIVDLLVDYTGTSCFCFENKTFLPAALDRYLKEKCSFLATFIIYHRFGPNNVVAESYRKNFIYSHIRDEILNLGFKLEEENKSDIQKIEKSMGKYEDFAQPGDQIFSYQVKARRWS